MSAEGKDPKGGNTSEEKDRRKGENDDQHHGKQGKAHGQQGGRWSSTSSSTQPRRTWKTQEVRGKQLLALDLFSGTGSVKKALEKRGWKTYSVDIEKRFHPDVVADILSWDYCQQFPRSTFTFDIIASSPPCTEYSSAMTRRPRCVLDADALVAKVKEIIHYYHPRLW